MTKSEFDSYVDSKNLDEFVKEEIVHKGYVVSKEMYKYLGLDADCIITDDCDLYWEYLKVKGDVHGR